MALPVILKILGDVLGAILPPLLTWFFSGSVTQSVKEVKGLPQLDTLQPVGPQMVLPVLGEDLKRVDGRVLGEEPGDGQE